MDRIRRLEKLVASLAAGQHANSSNSSDSTREVRDQSWSNTSQVQAGVEDSGQHELAQNVGQMKINDDQVVYLSAAHWETVRDEIGIIKDSLEEHAASENTRFCDQQEPTGPLLLQGLFQPPDFEDILALMPAKILVDRLVSRYLSSEDPSIGMSSYLRTGGIVPAMLGNPSLAMYNFHRRATECLLLSNYLKPSAYTIEALLLNLQYEFVRSMELDDGIWIMAATIIRLAMRAGYHRDPAQYPQLSCFQGEMRRRTWAIILQMDALVASQFSLPRMIAEDQCDTLLPRNLLDGDFDRNTIELPLSRPGRDYTPISFTIAKGRLLSAFAKVVNKELNQAYALIPEQLRMRSPGESITVPSSLLIRRYLIDVLYHKARCILHRGSMTKSRHDHIFSYSASSCIDAAMSLLTHQVSIHQAKQQGHVLRRERWWLSSLQRNDFLHAAMIVSLELDFRLNRGTTPLNEAGHTEYTSEMLFQALYNASRAWNESDDDSKQLFQARHILSTMLSKFAPLFTKVAHQKFARTEYGGSQAAVIESREPQIARPEYPLEAVHTSFVPTSLDVEVNAINDMINSQDVIDWELWELHLRNISEGQDA
ncbi:hypothetical protein LTR05_004431 [Lithohypha guttulata]|uniref:Xylanolytic transcriptional activator regulatory domain-containing protein n=1 Tax=Lithohypha guttulata TaxID=1690604 RepID=A0AAN7SYV5_9EURO|nr:hypothetical protein LTR05_004431 [Lithohypha guttulata]